MRLIYLFLLLPFFASAQCDPEGILLELQATTAKVGILFAEDGCIDALTVGSPLTFTGGVLDITSGDLTAASSKVTVTGGTGAVLGAGATVDVVPANILLSTLGGTLNLSQIAQGGATLNQVMQWNGTTWTPATVTATTDLTFSGTSSPVTLNSSTGTDVTITAGTNISLAATGTNLTINNTGAAALSGVVNQVPYFNTINTITTPTGSGTDAVTWDPVNKRIGVGTTSPGSIIEAVVPASTNGITSNYTYFAGASQRPFKAVNQDGLETFAIGASRTANEGNLFLKAPSVQGSGAGISFSSNNGGTAVSGIFQLDNSGNMVFRQESGTGSMYYDFRSGVYFRNSSLTDVNHINSSGHLSIAAGNSHPRALYVNGEARITDLTTDPPTKIVGADADGDLGEVALSGMSIVSGTLTATDGSVTNEAWTIDADDADTEVISNQTVKFQGGGIVVTDYVPGTDILTITGTEVDGSISNELQTYGHAGTTTYTNTLSSGGGSWSITGAGIAAISQTGGAVTVTATEVDGSTTNEGVLGVGAGSGTSSTLLSTTSGANAVTVNAAGILGITESTSANGGSITLTATEVDGSVTNEAQALTVSGTTTGILTLATAGGAGGGTATIAAGTGITVGQSGGTITITNSSPASGGWLLDGNTITSAKRIGSNDNFDVVVETNGTDRMWFDNGGTVSIGATQLTTAQLNINSLGSTNSGLLIAGGSGLIAPNFISITGSGSGSNANVFNAAVSMLSGNVEAKIENTSGSGTGGALLTMAVNAATTGDPKHIFTTGTTTWSEGIDNSVTGEPFKITANTDLGGATPAISATTANKVGVNQAAATVTLQVTGTDGIGFPQGTTAQRPTTPAFPVLRWNQTFSGFEVWDPNKSIWYRLTGVSSPTVASNTAAGTGHSAGLVAGAGSNDVRGAIELTTGSASLTAGTVITVTYAAAYSGIKTLVTLTPANDPATTEIAKWRIDSQTQNGFTIKAVSALTANETYQFNYYVGQ